MICFALKMKKIAAHGLLMVDRKNQNGQAMLETALLMPLVSLGSGQQYAANYFGDSFAHEAAPFRREHGRKIAQGQSSTHFGSRRFGGIQPNASVGISNSPCEALNRYNPWR